MMQSICYGKPALIIPVPNHPEQYGNARRAQEMGVAHAIHQRNIEKDGFILLVEEMLGDEKLGAHLAKLNAGHIGDGVGRSVAALSSIMRR